MQIRIGCVDGNTYESDYMSDADAQAEIDAQNGLIGTGDLADERFTLDDLLELMQEIVYEGSIQGESIKNGKINLNINGRERKFKAEHVVWLEVDRDQVTA